MPRPLLEAMVETAQDRRIPMEMSEPVVMFVKVEGFDAGLESVGDDEVHLRVQAFSSVFARVDAAAAARGGMLRRVTYQATGSDMLVCFGVLNAHTDDAVRAASMALQVRGIIDDVVEAVGSQLTAEVSFRIGMAMGPVFAGEMGVQLGRREFNLVGDPVNVAARLAAKAGPSEILLSPEVAAAVSNRFVLAPRGSLALKGKAEAMVVSELLGPIHA